MTELKTLNELGMYGFNECLRCSTIGERCGLCQNKIIKEEAIKQIKEIREASSKADFMELPVGYPDFGAAYDGEVENLINWIKHFFNIEEIK